MEPHGDSVPPDGAALDQARRTKERRYAWLFLARETGCQSKVGTIGDPCSGTTFLVQTLVHSIVMLCCAGVRLVIVGAPCDRVS